MAERDLVIAYNGFVDMWLVFDNNDGDGHLGAFHSCDDAVKFIETTLHYDAKRVAMQFFDV